MLSTNLLCPDENYKVRSNALTSANGLKFDLKLRSGSESWGEHIQKLCKITILEMIAEGRSVPALSEIREYKDIVEYLPIALTVYMSIQDFDTHDRIFAAFSVAYDCVIHLYPKLEVKTALVET